MLMGHFGATSYNIVKSTMNYLLHSSTETWPSTTRPLGRCFRIICHRMSRRKWWCLRCLPAPAHWCTPSQPSYTACTLPAWCSPLQTWTLRVPPQSWSCLLTWVLHNCGAEPYKMDLSLDFVPHMYQLNSWYLLHLVFKTFKYYW